MSQLSTRVPVGFRFHPTDEELVGYYLPKKVTARKIDLDLIRDLDLYKLEPWDLQELCKIQADSNEKQTDYYFFSRKDKKYPTGNRANRATVKGFWKATGRDKPIHKRQQTLIGMRKTLVFYQGRAPHGLKTDWIMHEFRLDDGPGRPAHEDGGWVVCRVFKKNKNLKTKAQERAISFEDHMGGVGTLLPEAHCSPDILTYPAHGYQPLQDSIKQEVINLDDYRSVRQSDPYVTKVETYDRGFSHSMPSSSDSDRARSYLCRALILRRPDDYPNLQAPYQETYDRGLGGCNDAQTSGSGLSGSGLSGSDCEEDSILELDNVDWGALLVQEPASGKVDEFLRSCAPPSTKGVAVDDVNVLVQLKRQNSDLFSSLDLWNYTQQM